MDRLDGKHVLLGVSGSIACHRALDVVRELRARGATVRVAPTKAATGFVTARAFEALSGMRVLGDALEMDDGKIPHVEEGYRADLAIVAPATADILAKMAHGFADEGLLATLLSYAGPLVIAPAMESRMWRHPATRANVHLLVDRGALLVGPVEGPLASGRSGEGRLAPVAAIIEGALAALAPPDLRGSTVVVTAGPTVEDLDPVRFLSNRSSGKMGVALARAAAQRGARVTLVHGPLEIPVPTVPGLHAVAVRSAQDLHDATLAIDADVAILAAAVADFRADTVAAQKIKKGSAETLSLELVRTKDTLAALGARKAAKDRPFLVGFAAETEHTLDNARRKLTGKGCDLICANDVSEAGHGFGADHNRITLVDQDGTRALAPATKDALADQILDEIVRRLGGA